MLLRPHTLKYKTGGGAPYRDDKGDWVTPEGGDEVEIPCRYEPNGDAKVIAGPDGTTVLYNGVVYLAKGAATISYGTSVNVYNDEDLIASGASIRFSEGQMNCRLWL